ncbi:hypothetical protein CHU00_13385 [Sphingobacterium cellulitidis]|uniref:vanadium-dependent haloperoxidase n=1 Tax=Sphingobacterium cellulitidis TaxID=1768011 RepID=UPI000B93E4B2|nr:vanadium-dependent haloperoxidase [Sphingobacterium cellulitidis]OYD45092.1 hypothetical protein CHU00_13385 [Sphingobacterium cellulitidis]
MSDKPLVLKWNQLTLEAIKLTKSPATIAARALAMVHTAMYDAWSVYDSCAISTTTANYIKFPKQHCAKEHIRKSFSYAAYQVLMHLFWFRLPAEHKNIFRDFMCQSEYDPDIKCLDIEKPEGIGKLIAKLVIEQHYGDGSNPLGSLKMPRFSDYTGYKPINSADQLINLSHWQPLKKVKADHECKVQRFALAHWGLVRAFALPFNWHFRPEPPYTKDQPEFKLQAREILDINAALTDEQKVIASYWEDGKGTYSTAGHWCEIAQFVAQKEFCRNSQCIKLFFVLSNALLDASIATWDSKRWYNAVRPVTAIRNLFNGLFIHGWAGPCKGTETLKGEQWKPYLKTPASPEYISAHSCLSRAAAVILKNFTGNDVFGGRTTIKMGSSSIENGVTPCMDIVLEWPTYSAAAEQAGLSCLYAGTHFSKATAEGHKVGLKVAVAVWEKAKIYFNEK